MPGERVASDPAAFWQAALRDLASQVSRANYDTWLDGTEGVRLVEEAHRHGMSIVAELESNHRRRRVTLVVSNLLEVGV